MPTTCWATLSIGAAGNFLAPISGLSENAFRTVVEIDTVSERGYHRVKRDKLDDKDIADLDSLGHTTQSKRPCLISANLEALIFMSPRNCITGEHRIKVLMH